MTPDEKKRRADELLAEGRAAVDRANELLAELAVKLPDLKRDVQQLKSELEAQLTQRPTK
jgi:hypothetical protein